MCGINGFVDFNQKLNQNDLVKGSELLSHRGPDNAGFFFEGKDAYHIGLASRRLAIIDPSEKGHQPMTSDCDNYILVFNGTIYNYKALRSELTDLGHQFHTQSNTDLFLNSYILLSKDCLNHLNGIFAFFILDKKKQEIFI